MLCIMMIWDVLGWLMMIDHWISQWGSPWTWPTHCIRSRAESTVAVGCRPRKCGASRSGILSNRGWIGVFYGKDGVTSAWTPLEYGDFNRDESLHQVFFVLKSQTLQVIPKLESVAYPEKITSHIWFWKGWAVELPWQLGDTRSVETFPLENDSLSGKMCHSSLGKAWEIPFGTFGGMVLL